MTAQPAQPDLSVYANIDPDDIYNAGGTSLTFFYTGTMYAKPYPTNHDDMLREDKAMFFDVFPDLEGVLPPSMIGDFLSFGRITDNSRLEAILRKANYEPDEVRRVGGSRGKALNFGDALLGRVGDYQGNLVMALWQSTTNEYFNDALENLEFLAPIRSQFGRRLNEMVVVGINESPRFWREFAPEQTIEPLTGSDVDTAQASDVETLKKKYKNSYEIAGGTYTVRDLGYMRGRVHSAVKTGPEYQQIMHVLCSDDLLKHPELQDYRPASCPRKDGDSWTPPQTKAQSWLDKTRELYTKEKDQGKEPSTGLLYPAWRAHSEIRKICLTFRDFLILDA